MLDYICKKCGCGNAPGSKFCTGCGEPIVIEDADPVTECSIEAPVEDDMEATTENNAKAISEDNAEVTAEDNAEAKTDEPEHLRGGHGPRSRPCKGVFQGCLP